MEQLIELLQQIQKLAGVGIDALTEALGGAGGEAPAGPPEGAPMPEEAPPAGDGAVRRASAASPQ